MGPKSFFVKAGEGRTFKRSPVEERTSVDGRVFDSKFELQAYNAICTIVPKGYLHLQEKFLLLPKKRIKTRDEGELLRDMTWTADFMIGPMRLHSEAPVSNQHLVIDVKGFPTPAFNVKIKIFKWRYEHIPLVANINSKAKMMDFILKVKQHCETNQWNIQS